MFEEECLTSLLQHDPANPSKRPRFKLNAMSKDGSVTIHIPRSFIGPLTATVKDGAICFSEQVKQQISTMSEANKTTRCFVGEFAGSSHWESDGTWTGDEVEVTVSDGRFKIMYDDEIKPKTKKKSLFFGHMFEAVFGDSVLS